MLVMLFLICFKKSTLQFLHKHLYIGVAVISSVLLSINQHLNVRMYEFSGPNAAFVVSKKVRFS